MNWMNFKEQIAQHSTLTLQFQYNENSWVDPSYHITEIKQVNITSVDCGGKMNAWTEVVVQLWEPSQSEGNSAMEVSKAMKIVDLVENTMPLNPLAMVKIEFGNSSFDTRQMHPSEIAIQGSNLVVNLQADKTQCKAIDRGDTCVKPKLQLAELTTATESCCAPAGGCC